MASKKPAAKPVPKKPAAKVVAKPVKKAAAPVKKAAKPLPSKTAKPTATKVVTKAPVKKVPVASKAVTGSKSATVSKSAAVTKSAVKAKPVQIAKKQAPVAAKKNTPKPVIKPVPAVKAKPESKPVVKPAVAAPVAKKQPEPPVKPVPEKKPVAAKELPKAPIVRKAVAKNAKDIKIAPAKAVTLPKINTTTARKYAPIFVNSVLDQPKNNPGGPSMRYSDAELAEFRELIQRKLEAAKKELNYLQGLITRKDEMGGDESENRYMTMEDGSLSMEREQLSQMASRQITFIDHLEKAIMRIENKTYGICRVTGKLIDKARLRAVPHATLSIEAKMGIVK
jgi:RNA polymerase-binding transcription factor DksA